jgi:hypothetical protein
VVAVRELFEQNLRRERELLAFSHEYGLVTAQLDLAILVSSTTLEARHHNGRVGFPIAADEKALSNQESGGEDENDSYPRSEGQWLHPEHSPLRLTGIRRENPAFNYRFFRPNRLASLVRARETPDMTPILSDKSSQNKPKVLDQVSDVIRLRHFRIRTVQSYIRWDPAVHFISS